MKKYTKAEWTFVRLRSDIITDSPTTFIVWGEKAADIDAEHPNEF